MIFDQSWIKKYKIIIDITNNFLAFWYSHYIYIRHFFPIILNQPILFVIIKIEKDIILLKRIKKSSIEDITNFLQVPNKLSNKKKQINKNKQNANIQEINLRKAIISSLNSFNKEQ